MIQLVSLGITRHVILIGRVAIKIPRLNYGWSRFLSGLIANMSEAAFGRVGLDGFCPVLMSVPGGWLVVQRRVRMMTEAEWTAFDPVQFCIRVDYYIPAEHKPDSFGILPDGSIVAVDYADAMASEALVVRIAADLRRTA